MVSTEELIEFLKKYPGYSVYIEILDLECSYAGGMKYVPLDIEDNLAVQEEKRRVYFGA